jgi:hypothetical protein
MWSRLIKLSPVHDRSYRDWNQRTVIVEYALQRFLGPSNDLTVDLSNAAVDAQWIYGTH